MLFTGVGALGAVVAASGGALNAVDVVKEKEMSEKAIAQTGYRIS